MNLTDTQKQAIAHTKANLQLIACAGSGKTEVVARFVANLLNPRTKPKIVPANIIAFTFTEKAAAELKERIVTRCHEENGDQPGLAELYVGTIHAFCLDLLKTEVPRFLKFEVLNEVQQSLFVDRHSKQSGLTTTTDLNGPQGDETNGCSALRGRRHHRARLRKSGCGSATYRIEHQGFSRRRLQRR
jgi:DNA helicase-2/ATP-dependent DNA helicase PcrA